MTETHKITFHLSGDDWASATLLATEAELDFLDRLIKEFRKPENRSGKYVPGFYRYDCGNAHYVSGGMKAISSSDDVSVVWHKRSTFPDVLKSRRFGPGASLPPLLGMSLLRQLGGM